MINIAFLTGARSEYGVAKPLLRRLSEHENICLKTFPNGMHLLKEYGYTVSEIEKDGFYIAEMIHTYEASKEKAYQFSKSLDLIYKTLKMHDVDLVFLIGDRPEAYTAALAAHFLNIPIAHFGGGTLTAGAVDNYYRYNISNLATLHFVTSKNNYVRLRNCILVKDKDVHFTGSLAIDSILKYLAHSNDNKQEHVIVGFTNYALITFHPVTSQDEDIPKLLEVAVDLIIEKEREVVITYPNNDEGSDKIISAIDQYRDHQSVHVVESLGAEGYYRAIDNCLFVVGNSSSGIIEVPYFNKISLNVGSRQEGRDKDLGVINVAATENRLKKALITGFDHDWEPEPCNRIYGNGQSTDRISEIILDYFSKESCK